MAFLRVCLVFLLLTACRPTQAAPTQTRVASLTPALSPIQPSETAPAATITMRPAPTRTTTPTFTPTLPLSDGISENDLKGTQIAVWHPWTGELALQIQAMVDEFNGSNPYQLQVAIAQPGSSSELFRQVSAAIGSPGGPDVVVATPEQADTWQSSGKGLVELSDYLHDPAVGFSPKDVVDFRLLYWNMGQAGVQRLGIPAIGSLQVLLYNQSWARSLGFDKAPTNPVEFEQQACKAAEANRRADIQGKQGTGGWLVNTDAAGVVGWLGAFGSNFEGSEKNHYRFKSDESIAAFTYLKGLVDKGCAWLGKDPEPYDYFAGRYALFYTGSLNDVTQQKRQMINAGSKDQWTILPFPAVKGKPLGVAYGSAYSILKSTPARQMAAWLFIRWMAAPEQQIRLVQASGTSPLRESVAGKLDSYGLQNPQWVASTALLADARPVPQQASWRLVRNVLQDAAWQVFQPETKAGDIPAILDQLDRVITELLK